ncbi:MAG: hypothetical protein K0R50_4761 [Eubacterium sp.]|nr:hypothetical protein [Eubacterium sp.]
METEKITINIGAIDLGHIDLLVEQGFYTNRTDFIRTAIRNQMTVHSGDISSIKASGTLGLNSAVKEINKLSSQITGIVDQSISDIDNGIAGGTGVFSYSRKSLEQVKLSGNKISLFLIGMLLIDKDVPAELVKETFKKVKVYGIIKASDEVKKVISELK